MKYKFYCAFAYLVCTDLYASFALPIHAIPLRFDSGRIVASPFLSLSCLCVSFSLQISVSLLIAFAMPFLALLLHSFAASRVASRRFSLANLLVSWRHLAIPLLLVASPGHSIAGPFSSFPSLRQAILFIVVLYRS